jgi:hypothetical protein
MNPMATAPEPTTTRTTLRRWAPHRGFEATLPVRGVDIAPEPHGPDDAEPRRTADAAEPHGAGDATGAGGSAALTVSPTEYPVLARLPDLAAVLAALQTADAAMLTAVVTLADVLDTDEVATHTGVPVEHWIAITGRATRMDRRQVLRTARLLHRFPVLAEAARTRAVTWTQLRALTLVLRRCPTELDATADGLLGDLIEHLDGADPDALVRQVEDAVERWRADLRERDPEPDLPVTPHLSLQPRLDGLGGRLVGELDAQGLALLDAATAPGPTQRSDPDGVGAVRARNLLARLAGATGGTIAPDTTQTRGTNDAAAGHGQTEADADALPPVRLLLRMDLDALLDRASTPATLLTRLLGGRLRLTSDAARRLVDERGAELRTVVIDDLGQVVGVGRQRRIPPDWLRDAVQSIHDTCTGPLCDRPAAGADIDHAQPWWPERPDEPFGTTDLDNLGPLCASTNRALRRAGWRATPLGDGRRSWHHTASGLSIISVPATWHPPPRGSPPTGA